MSVVVPVFNRLALLEKTVASLSAQTLADAEFILIDDRSDEAVQRYLAALSTTDPRFTVIVKPAGQLRGCQNSRNLGLDQCSGEAVVFLDSDDLLSPTCLDRRHAFMSSHPETDIVVGSQAIFTAQDEKMHLVNVPDERASNIDRFLALSHPLDVPWVNGGVAIKISALSGNKIRWRPEFHWDDVAFHFECVAKGMTVRWLPEREPDSFYRSHSLDRFGEKLFSPDGLLSSARMLAWMRDLLETYDELNEPRRARLVTDFFHACFMRAVDLHLDELAADLVSVALDGKVLTRAESRRMRTYAAGRLSFRSLPRVTYYWNRFSEATILSGYTGQNGGTFGTIVANTRERSLAPSIW